MQWQTHARINVRVYTETLLFLFYGGGFRGVPIYTDEKSTFVPANTVVRVDLIEKVPSDIDTSNRYRDSIGSSQSRVCGQLLVETVPCIVELE